MIIESCITCDSEADKFCKSKPSKSYSRECPPASSKLGCYHFIDLANATVSRGCMNNLTSDELIEKCNENGLHCKTCIGDNCNLRSTFQFCYSCDSKRDENCIQIDEKLTNTTLCSDYTANCVTGIDYFGHTHRRCSVDDKTDETDFPHGFDVCTRSKCNKKLYPGDRLQCFQCYGTEDCDFMSPDENSTSVAQDLKQPCKIASEFNECFTLLDNGKYL